MNTMWVLFVLVAVFYTRQTDGCSCAYSHPQVHFCNAAYVIKASVISSQYIYPPTQEPEPTAETTAYSEQSYASSVYDEEGAFIQGNFAEAVPGETERVPPAQLIPPVAMNDFPGQRFYNPYERESRPISMEYTIKVEKIFKGGNYLVERTLAKIYTAPDDGLCGQTSLAKETSYIMAGSFYDDELRINLCNWVVPYKSLTRIQRRGLKLMYKQSCGVCTIATCYGQTCKFAQPGDDFCMFDGFAGNSCEAQHSVCTRSKKSCKWQRNRDYRKCQVGSDQQHNSFMP